MENIKDVYKTNQDLSKNLITDIENVLKNKKVKYTKINEFEFSVEKQTKDKLKKILFNIDYLNNDNYKTFISLHDMNGVINIRQKTV